MPNLHWGELLLILLIVVIIFGASRLPMIGEGLGKAIRGFKRSMNERDDIDVKRVPERSTAERPPRGKKKVEEDEEDEEVVATAKTKPRASTSDGDDDEDRA